MGPAQNPSSPAAAPLFPSVSQLLTKAVPSLSVSLPPGGKYIASEPIALGSRGQYMFTPVNEAKKEINNTVLVLAREDPGVWDLKVGEIPQTTRVDFLWSQV